MRRRQVSRQTNHIYAHRNTIDCARLFNKNMEDELEQTLAAELEKFKQITSCDFAPAYDKSYAPKHFDTAQRLDNSKFSTIDNLNLKREDAEQLRHVRFTKIVNELKLIFIGCPKIMIVYDRAADKTHVERLDKDYMTCMDYDPVSGVLVFGHSLGKFTFSKWTGSGLKKIDKIKIEGYSLDAIKDVKFVSGVDVLAFLDAKNTSELLIRIPGRSIRYRNKYILESKVEHFEVSHLSLGNGEKSERNRPNTVLIAYTCHADVKLIAFNTLYENGEFKDIVKIRKVTTITRPAVESLPQSIGNLFDESRLTDTSELKPRDSRLDNSLSSRSSTLGGPSARNFVLFDNKQWMFENQPYAIFVWGSVIEQYFITPTLDFVKSFTLTLDQNILAAYIGSTELLVAVLDNFEISFIYLEKLRYTLDTQKSADSFMEQKESFATSLNHYTLGSDTASKGICLLSNGTLQYFQVFEWVNYIENLKAQSLYIEALFTLNNLAKGMPTKLHGAVYPDARSSTFTLIDLNTMEDFGKDLKEVVRELMVEMAEWLRNKKQGVNLLEVCIELLIKTQNFELLYSDFLDVILSNKEKDDRLAEVFIKQLASYLNNNILNEYFSIDFFVKIFELIDAKQNIEILEKFLFYLVQTFTLKPEILEVLKVMAYNKHMPLFTFFLLLHNPTSKDNLDYMQRQIETCIETIPLNTEELRDSTNRLFSYLYDLFNNASLLDIDRNTRKNKSEIARIRETAKNWFMDASHDFFLKMFGPKSIYLLLAIHRHYSVKTPNNIATSTRDESVLLTNVQLDFNVFMIELYEGQMEDVFHVLAMFTFATHAADVHIGDRYVVGVMLKLLGLASIKKLRTNKNVNFDYFFNHMYDLYYAHRDVLKTSPEFGTFIAALADEE